MERLIDNLNRLYKDLAQGGDGCSFDIAGLVKDAADAITRLTAQVEALERATEDMTHIISNAAYDRCEYCVCGEVPCPAQGLNAECNFEYAAKRFAGGDRWQAKSAREGSGMRLTKRIGASVYYKLGKYPETIPAECETTDVRTILKSLAIYEDIGEPEELVKPIRCRECKHAEDTCKNPSDYIAPYWCHELDRRMSAIDYCSCGEPKDSPEMLGE